MPSMGIGIGLEMLRYVGSVIAGHIASILMEGSGYILMEDGTSSIGLE